MSAAVRRQSSVVRPVAGGPVYDIVIANARVIDPETKLDAIRSVAIAKGKIAAITATPLNGRTLINARGLVLAPGFIDVHAHGQDAENYRHYAMDGVTSAMELELGTGDVDSWYSERAGKALVNYGVSIGHMRVRMRVMGDSSTTYASGDAAHRGASDSEISAIRDGIIDGLARGAIGVGFGLSYTPSCISLGSARVVSRGCRVWRAGVRSYAVYR